MALVGLGPDLEQRGWGHGSYHWVEDHGLSNSGGPYAVQRHNPMKSKQTKHHYHNSFAIRQ